MFYVYSRDVTAGGSWVRNALPVSGRRWQDVRPLQYHAYEFKVTQAGNGDESTSSATAAVPPPPKPYACNYLTPSSPNRIGSDRNGTLSFQWNIPINQNSAAWGFKLSPALIKLGNNGKAPAVLNAYYSVNGRLDPSMKVDTGETADYWFHSGYRGIGGRGLYAGDEVNLDISVTFNYGKYGTGLAVVHAKDCYQLAAA